MRRHADYSHWRLHQLVMQGKIVIFSQRPFGPYEIVYWPDPSRLEHHHEVANVLGSALLQTSKWDVLFRYRPDWYDDSYTCRKENCGEISCAR